MLFSIRHITDDAAQAAPRSGTEDSLPNSHDVCFPCGKLCISVSKEPAKRPVVTVSNLRTATAKSILLALPEALCSEQQAECRLSPSAKYATVSIESSTMDGNQTSVHFFETGAGANLLTLHEAQLFSWHPMEKYVAVLCCQNLTPCLQVYDLEDTRLTCSRILLAKPSILPGQPWSCDVSDCWLAIGSTSRASGHHSSVAFASLSVHCTALQLFEPPIGRAFTVAAVEFFPGSSARALVATNGAGCSCTVVAMEMAQSTMLFEIDLEGRGHFAGISHGGQHFVVANCKSVTFYRVDNGSCCSTLMMKFPAGKPFHKTMLRGAFWPSHSSCLLLHFMAHASGQTHTYLQSTWLA